MKNVFEQYYSASGGVLHNIAVPMSIQQNHLHRFTLIDQMTQIDRDVYLIPHNIKHLKSINKKVNYMLRRTNNSLVTIFLMN